MNSKVLFCITAALVIAVAYAQETEDTLPPDTDPTTELPGTDTTIDPSGTDATTEPPVTDITTEPPGIDSTTESPGTDLTTEPSDSSSTTQPPPVTSTPAPVSCGRQTCRANECCIQIGRRQRCRSLLREWDRCDRRYQCPCGAGLTCREIRRRRSYCRRQ